MGDGVVGAAQASSTGIQEICGLPFVCSWSGGKDSCLALLRAVAAGGELKALVCMMREDGEHSRSHGLPATFLQAQAAALGVPAVLRPATWDDYEEVFTQTLRDLSTGGVRAAVFGDIDIEEHRAWEERVARKAGLRAFLPLWGSSRRALLAEVFAAPVEALIVTAHAPRLDGSFVGRRLTPSVAQEIEAAGADGCGENGEYHTAVLDCPLFCGPVGLRMERTVRVDDYWQAKVLLQDRDDVEEG